MRPVAVLVLLLALLGGACSGSGSAEPPEDPRHVTVLIERAQVKVQSGYPASVFVFASGYLGTPCEELLFEVGRPVRGVVDVDLFAGPYAGGCILVLEGFKVVIPIGSFTQGRYVAMVNGEPYPFRVGSPVAVLGEEFHSELAELDLRQAAAHEVPEFPP